MFKIKNTEITDKWGFQHTCYVATATQNLKDIHNLVYGHVHILWSYKEDEIKIPFFFLFQPDCDALNKYNNF